jgi:dihydroneopterin aldolase
VDPRDEIRLVGLKFATQLGVPSEERASWQTVEANISLYPTAGLGSLADRLDRTIDYAAVQTKVIQIGRERPRLLLETLAEHIAQGIF